MDDDVIVIKMTQPSRNAEFNHLLLTQPIKQEPGTSPSNHPSTSGSHQQQHPTSRVPPSNPFQQHVPPGPPMAHSPRGIAGQHPGPRVVPPQNVHMMQPPTYFGSQTRPARNLIMSTNPQAPPNALLGMTGPPSSHRPILTSGPSQNSTSVSNRFPSGQPSPTGLGGYPQPNSTSVTGNGPSHIFLTSSQSSQGVLRGGGQQAGPVSNNPRTVVRPQILPMLTQQQMNARSQRPILPVSNGPSHSNMPSQHQQLNSGPPAMGVQNSSSGGPSLHPNGPPRHPPPATVSGPAPPPPTSTTGSNIQWGQIHRDPQQNTVFHGVSGLCLNSTDAILQHTVTEPLVLDAQVAVLSADSSDPIDTTELLKGTPVEGTNRKGFHKCLGCSSVFLTASTYQEHVNRLVLRIDFSCSDCSRHILVYNRCALLIHVKGHSPNPPVISPSALTVTPLSMTLLTTALDAKDKAEKVDFNTLTSSMLPNWDFDLFSPFTRLASGRRFYLMERAKEPVPPTQTCALCEFHPSLTTQDSSTDNLLHHLLGSATSANSPTKCALCTLVVPINRETVCAFKAHILLHMGIYVMCPRCGFQAPTDLSPPEAEEVMRLHLRFVCFHFNVVQIFLCSRCTSGKAFNSVLQYTTHIYEEHSTKRYRCNVCFSKKAGANLETYEFTTLADVIQHLQAKHTQEMQSNKPRLYSTPNRCPECPKSFTNKQEFIDHHVKYHNKSSTRGKTAYRCFGECKQIHREFSDLRDHMITCTQMKQILDSAPPSHYFCLYCGIGARRRTIGNGQYVASYKCTFTDNLVAIHQHEASHLNLENSNGGHTACPWCKEKMAPILDRLLEHMRGHLKENKVIAEALRRAEEYECVEGVDMACHCRFPLDSASAIESHANCPETGHMPVPREILEAILSSKPRQQTTLDCAFCSETKDSLWTMVQHTFHSHKNQACYVCLAFSVPSDAVKGRRQLWKHILKCMRSRVVGGSSDISSSSKTLAESTFIINGFAAEETLGEHLITATDNNNKTTGGIANGDIIDVDSAPNSISVDSTSANQESPSSSAQGSSEAVIMEAALFDCSKCASHFFSESELESHWRTDHGVSLMVTCVLCGLKFTSTNQLTRHHQNEHSAVLRNFGVAVNCNMRLVLDSSQPITYRCHLCSKPFDKRASCERHMTVVHKFFKSDINWAMLTESNDPNKKRVKTERSESPSPVDTKRIRLEPSSKSTSPTSTEQKTESTKLPETAKLGDSTEFPETTKPPEATNGTPLPVFECALCNFSTEIRQDFLTHLLDLHRPLESQMGDREIYLCCDCGLTFVSEKALKIHLIGLHRIKDTAAWLHKWDDYVQFTGGLCRADSRGSRRGALEALAALSASIGDEDVPILASSNALTAITAAD